jgi:hypothetical protein
MQKPDSLFGSQFQTIPVLVMETGISTKGNLFTLALWDIFPRFTHVFWPDGTKRLKYNTLG